MKYIAIFIYLLLILIIRIDQQQAIPHNFLSRRYFQSYPLSLDDTNNDIEQTQYERLNERDFRNFLNDPSLFQQQRRFGNTKYGRSLFNK
ncbi:unnamed protein product [Rotaria sordida]|uniref:Uncharacterized protein n=1 Tax=Rotaria sordida TaxID=392033 RepID=A0A813UIC3_9BILA|nr:unnamed protein product [Rotaria sordida]CAF0823805.1 unnamed protein product [Rotaria sordida]CAF0824655.1 unnamed protein product [Rotaria sordida]CAF0844431.1 unnamed protein product [Rotaria sordida]CAF0846251.1 unnamed protein product [Rotaria sordida]